jgi:Family of unknown function (DUF6252)
MLGTHTLPSAQPPRGGWRRMRFIEPPCCVLSGMNRSIKTFYGVLRSSLAAIVCTMMISCSDTGPTQPRSGGIVTATVQGASWRSSSANAAYTGRVLHITSTFQTPSAGLLMITLYDVGTTGTYAIGVISGESINAAHVEVAGRKYSTAILPALSGSVQITRLTSDSVAGTFQFVGLRNGSPGSSDSLFVTDGTFAVALER